MANDVVTTMKNGGVIIAGTVAAVKEVDDKNTEVVFEKEVEKNGSVQINRYTVNFRDLGDKKDYSTYIRKGKVEAGKIIMCLAIPSKDKTGYYMGYQYKYNGIFTLKGKPDAENKGDRYSTSVVLGTVVRASKLNKNGEEIAGGKCTKVSVVIDSDDEKKRDEGKGDFINIDFWNDPDKKGKEKFADNALNVLKPREEDDKKKTAVAIIVTGEAKNYEASSGNVYRSYSAFSFTKVRENVKDSAESATEPPAETVPVESDDDFVKIDESAVGDIPFFNPNEAQNEAPEETQEKLPWE